MVYALLEFCFWKIIDPQLRTFLSAGFVPMPALTHGVMRKAVTSSLPAPILFSLIQTECMRAKRTHGLAAPPAGLYLRIRTTTNYHDLGAAVEEDPAKYRVLFVRDLETIQHEAPGTIYLAPSKDNWNDFGERILIDIRIYPRRLPEAALELAGLFGLLEENDKADTTPLRAILNNMSGPYQPPDGLPGYFTMLPNMASYRHIVDRMGSDEARLALQAINDMVETDDRPVGKHWVRTAKGSSLFLNSFLRNGEAYFAWKNAATILQGVEHEALGQTSEALRVQFQLAGRPNEHDLTFRFSHKVGVLPRRFAVVIGKNGVGKSQTLAQIVDASLRGKATLTDGNGNRPIFNRILAFYPSSNTSSVFPSDRRKRARVWYRRFSMIAGRSRQTTSDLVVQLARSIEGIAGQNRFKIFIEAITGIEGSEELALRTRRHGRRAIPIRTLNSGGEQDKIRRYASIDISAEPVRAIEGRTYPLSSGELSFLRFAALASLYIENGSLLLFDEPETHLHPNFINQFVALLDGLLEQTGSVAVLSTHSVYFVREAFEDQVIVLRSDPDRRIVAEMPTLKTFGADVGAISYFVFGEDRPSRLALEVERKIADRSASWEEVFDLYKDSLSLDLLGEIRARIEDTDREADEQ
ncbi:AAA family ATPase (plasmid) [Rhizobium leguminosarum]|uniref:AAA family ATPase n=1 Tax=Rhizobium leguminosarum TaxID=384 RepID=UPI00102FB0A6|nr:AAA family ATPase [Rhizobium leguminosarum]TBG30576.1 AAA family ATPase [Rhizobium leguminosarum]